MTQLRITAADGRHRVLHRWTEAIDPEDDLLLLARLRKVAKEQQVPKGWGRLAIEARHPRKGWLRYEQPR